MRSRVCCILEKSSGKKCLSMSSLTSIQAPLLLAFDLALLFARKFLEEETRWKLGKKEVSECKMPESESMATERVNFDM